MIDLVNIVPAQEVSYSLVVTIPLLVAGLGVIYKIIDIARDSIAEYERIMGLSPEDQLKFTYDFYRKEMGCGDDEAVDLISGSCVKRGTPASACPPPMQPTGFQTMSGRWACERGPGYADWQRCVEKLSLQFAAAAGQAAHTAWQFRKKAEEICNKWAAARPKPPPMPDVKPFGYCVADMMAKGHSYVDAVLLCHPRRVTILAAPQVVSCVTRFQMMGYSLEQAELKCLKAAFKLPDMGGITGPPIGHIKGAGPGGGLGGPALQLTKQLLKAKGTGGPRGAGGAAGAVQRRRSDPTKGRAGIGGRLRSSANGLNVPSQGPLTATARDRRTNAPILGHRFTAQTTPIPTGARGIFVNVARAFQTPQGAPNGEMRPRTRMGPVPFAYDTQALTRHISFDNR